MSREYTAQEMREEAEFVENRNCVKLPVAVSMLRYAAEMVERCDRQKNYLDGLLEGKDYELAGVTLRQVVDTEKSIVDYILRGDTGKKAK